MMSAEEFRTLGGLRGASYSDVIPATAMYLATPVPLSDNALRPYISGMNLDLTDDEKAAALISEQRSVLRTLPLRLFGVPGRHLRNG
jgi:hypothetical protein